MKLLGNIIKSKSDKQKYKLFKLPNEMTCLVVSDQEAEKSSAALSVAVGSLQDPNEAQGLAHYLEHMLFMGTDKYPNESDYQQFITKNSGSTNAYTDLSSTNYFFDVVNGVFPDALDRFSQFFISPLMSDSSSQRELNAVHSQHSKNLQSDLRKKYQLSKILSKQGHPYKKFSTGDKTTLSNPNLREMLHNFYNAHYSSNIMNLVVYGKQEPDEMMKLVQKLFSQVKNKNLSRCVMQEMPYDKKALGKLIKMVPVRDSKSIQLWWILKDKAGLYKNDPGSYYSHLIGHQGKGSLLQHLIDQGLAMQLSAGHSNLYSCYSKFYVQITLTEKGINSIPEIINKIYGYLLMLQEKGPQNYAFQEIQKSYRMRFDYQDKRSGANYCSSLAHQMHEIKNLQQILCHHYLMEEYNPKIISQYLQQLLDKDNMIVFAIAKQFEQQCDSLEPIYNTKYKIQDIPQIGVARGHVKLPQQNIFLPSNLSVLPLSTNTKPKKLTDISDEKLEVFFKQDHLFELPKSRILLMVYFNGLPRAEQLVSRMIFKDMFKKHVKELSYMAQTANISTDFSMMTYDAQISISGFSETLSKYTIYYLQQLIKYEPTQQDRNLFETFKQKLVRSYSNYFLSNPYELATNLRTRSLREGAQVSPSDKLKAAEQITLEDVIQFGRKWKKQLYMESYITGNYQEQDARAIASQIKEVFAGSKPLPKQAVGLIRPVIIQSNGIAGVQQAVVNKNDANSCAIVHFQQGKWTIKSSVLKSICLAFIRQPTFDYLRTKQQLGYIVGALGQEHRGVIGISILVQSNIKSSHQIIQYIDRFLDVVLKEKIERLNQQEFEKIKSGILSSKIEKDKKLSQQSSRYWDQILSHKYNFFRKEEQIEMIPKITLLQFKEFMHELIYKTPCRFEAHLTSQMEQIKERNKIALEKRNASSKQGQQTNCEQSERQSNNNSRQYHKYQNYKQFKSKSRLFPDFYSHL